MKIKNIYKISKWETLQTSPSFNGTTILVILLLLGVVVGSGALAVSQDTSPDANIYSVGVDENSQYYDVVEASNKLNIVDGDENDLESGNIELLVKSDDSVLIHQSDKGNAALVEFQQAVSQWNNLKLEDEDRDVAYPVRVDIHYISSSNESVLDQIEDDETSNTSTDDNVDDGNGDEDDSSPLLDSLLPETDGVQSVATPSNITPPFPFQSVVFALLFLIPLNFVAQAYASSIMKERINRRGELLLVTPISKTDIIVGKTIPYFLAMVSIVSAISLLTGGGIISIIAMIPIIILFLASVFVASLIARSYKELTFFTVAISIGLIAYSFIPAIFTDIHPIALVSPLTIVVTSIDGGSVTLLQFAFSTIPLTITGLILFIFGAGMYREEDLFTQKPIHETLIDSLSHRVTGLLSIPIITALTIPFVFAIQLLALAMLFPIPPEIAILLLFTVVVIVEEIAKSIHVYAGMKNGVLDTSKKTALIAGGLSGIGFFVAEKLTVITQYVGLQQTEIGQAAFGATTTMTSPLMSIVSLLFPLILHMVTAMLSAYGARSGFKSYMLWMGLAMIIHLSYNLTIIMVFLL